MTFASAWRRARVGIARMGEGGWARGSGQRDRMLSGVRASWPAWRFGLLQRMALMTQVKHWIAGVMAVVTVYALVPVASAEDFGELERRGCCSHHSGVCGC